ncbi:hypothetical protein QFC19_003586 [Naganishia cerealis]|uniref:Uncharacterized protein n=1 Tax=Naganishia cerealis TaxID=610337 RepID=A0ACC2W0C2_9TREE|nr:hypothetical protein QFC19_003586 [Naganishia cerealis]
MSFSIIRESNDLPAFRPSSDFILPGRQRDHPSIDFGRPSIAQDDRASFSVEGCGDTCFSTPRYQPQRNGSRGPGSTLPEMTAVNFLAEFKGAIREMGMRAEDTPAREAVRSVLAGLATPHVATKKGSSTSIRSILKKRPSSEVMRIASARSLGHSLPPIPIDIAKAVSRKGSTYSIASTGRSTPIFVPEEEYTSASHITLSLPPPRNVRSNGKSSIGPLSLALHPVSEREEPVLRCDIVESASENNIDRLGVIPPQPSHFVPVSDKVSELVSDNIHGRSSSTNTAIEEIETIMTMDSPTTASYLKTHLSRPNSLVTENYVVPTSAPASAHPHTLQASQSTQRIGSHSALKSSRSTPAFVISTDWSSSRATANAKNGGHTKDHARPSSTYSYLEKELGLPRLPDRVVITSAKRGSRAETKIGTQRQLLSEVTGNAVRAAHTFSVAKETGRTTKVKGSLAAATSSSPEQVGKPRVADENGQSSPRKGVRKLKVEESTRVGEKDASLKVMRF